jgi:hypothetical protein
MDMAIVAGVLAVILVIVMVMYFRQFSRLQDVTEDRSLLTIANHSLTTQRDNWIANYDKLSASAAQHSKTLVSILDFLMEEAKVDPQWVLEKGGLDKGVMEYVHSTQGGTEGRGSKAYVELQRDHRQSTRSRRVHMMQSHHVSGLRLYRAHRAVGCGDERCGEEDRRSAGLQELCS